MRNLSSDVRSQGFTKYFHQCTRFLKANPLFTITVFIPTILAIIYYGLIASDIYISESRFILRSPQQRAQMGVLGSLLQGTGFSTAQDDSYAVHDFILSRDALKELNDSLNLNRLFSDWHIDFLHRFAALGWDKSFEALYRYYPKRVSVDYDTSTSISVLRVNAFNADSAQKINELLLNMSERLVNSMSDRARQDIIQYATAEAKAAEDEATDAEVALAAFRNQKYVLDPEKQSTIQFQEISKMQDELIAAKTQLTQLRTYTPNNPQIPQLNTRVTTLQAEIAVETAKVAGGAGSLANKAASYERLAVEREFADKELAAALNALVNAHNEAQHQQLYLERLVEPNRPDIAIEPRRVRSIIVVFIVGMLSWGILSLLIAAIREHHD